MILILLNYLNRWNINCANADLNVCSIVQNVYIFCNKFYLVYWLIHFRLNLLFATVIKWDIKYLENWRAMKLAVMYFGFARSQGWGLLVDKRGNDRECQCQHQLTAAPPRWCRSVGTWRPWGRGWCLPGGCSARRGPTWSEGTGAGRGSRMLRMMHRSLKVEENEQIFISAGLSSVG